MAKEVYCNICGKKMDEWDLLDGYSMETALGYGSKYDGDYLELDICCECFDKLIEYCKIPPVKTLRDKEESSEEA